MDKMEFREMIKQRLYDLAKENVESLRKEALSTPEEYSAAVDAYTGEPTEVQN